jgi:hypothetical protein
MFFFVLMVLAIPISLYVIRELKDVRTWMMKEFAEPDYGWP